MAEKSNHPARARRLVVSNLVRLVPDVAVANLGELNTAQFLHRTAVGFAISIRATRRPERLWPEASIGQQSAAYLLFNIES
jgi:light-regulated signal transduction histidine kinase (bacteriophytochrome)